MEFTLALEFTFSSQPGKLFENLLQYHYVREKSHGRLWEIERNYT